MKGRRRKARGGARYLWIRDKKIKVNYWLGTGLASFHEASHPRCPAHATVSHRNPRKKECSKTIPTLDIEYYCIATLLSRSRYDVPTIYSVLCFVYLMLQLLDAFLRVVAVCSQLEYEEASPRLSRQEMHGNKLAISDNVAPSI